MQSTIDSNVVTGGRQAQESGSEFAFDIEHRAASGSAPAPSYSVASIEQLDDMCHQLGWPVEYRQMDPGPFSSNFAQLEDDAWFLLEEQSSRRLEVVTGAPAGLYVLALVDDEPVVVNGQSLNSNRIAVLSPGSDARATLPARARVTQIGVVESEFEDMLRAVAPGLSLPRGQVALFDTTPCRSAHLRRTMRAALRAPSRRPATRAESASRILADALTATADQGTVPYRQTLHRDASRRALVRAREYIEANLSETIRVASMCRYAGTSLRSLELIFARELGIPPKQYVKARRLNAVRRRLLAADARRGLVTEAALEFGFIHLGRFATDYRRFFGESPRTTLLTR